MPIRYTVINGRESRKANMLPGKGRSRDLVLSHLHPAFQTGWQGQENQKPVWNEWCFYKVK